MIHQHILAAPRPGMSEFDFQDYWRYVHALKFARKIPQIKKYKLDLRKEGKLIELVKYFNEN